MSKTYLKFGLIAFACALMSIPSFAEAQSFTQRGTRNGALAGAILGGIVGAQNDETLAGVAIGGIVGGVAGRAIGRNQDARFYGGGYSNFNNFNNFNQFNHGYRRPAFPSTTITVGNGFYNPGFRAVPVAPVYNRGFYGGGFYGGSGRGYCPSRGW